MLEGEHAWLAFIYNLNCYQNNNLCFPFSDPVNYYYYTTSKQATKPVASLAYMEIYKIMMEDGKLTDSIPETVFNENC